jgi:POT family proton-dependent oligopeptide transporter
MNIENLETVQRQPKALKFLFMTEMWERFSYFALLSLLVLFMTKNLQLMDNNAYLVFGAFLSLLFITPLIGGFLADRFINQISAVIIGAIFLFSGYLLLSIGNNQLFFIALSLLIIGNGFFKPNISSLLGTFFHENDPRRDRGFLIFYLGINIGATIGVISCGIVAKIFGWQLAFLMCSISMLLGLTLFLINLAKIKKNIQIPLAVVSCKRLVISILGAIASLPIIFILLKHTNLENLGLVTCAITLLAIFGIISKKLDRIAKNKLIVAIILIIFSVAFWSLYQQSFMSLTLFLDRDVNKQVFGMLIPTSTIGTLNGFFLIGLAPILVMFEKFLTKRKINLHVATKFALGILLMGIGYMILMLSTKFVTASQQTSLAWIITSFALQTLGELFLSPVGLSMITEFAPNNLRSLMMGTWFFSLSAASAIGGELAKVADIPKNITDQLSSATIYGHAFTTFGIAAIVIALLLFLAVPKIKQML